MPRTDPSIVCVNDDSTARQSTVDAFAGAGIDARPCTTLDQVEDALGRDVSCVVTAATVGDGDAFDVVRLVRETSPDTPVVVFTGDPRALDSLRQSELVVEFASRSLPNARERLVSLVSNAALETYQVAYPVPADEQERIRALREYDVEDSGAVDAFDRLTALIARHFDIDVAFVGLLDEHEERFVACEGANWERLARENSICTHTVLDEEVTVVEDVTEDPRFASNDRLRELDIRSYAGARLTTPEGHAIGALCCVDDEPRSYSESERTDLALFAEEAREQLVLRSRLNGARTETST